ncbi:spore germination protein PA/spore germination protein PF [Salsuginibacillus halophilus]|uniref:Spore germination protein PA/spore germination protein PF n=1 Tax=Salsuginibacillus halophilus TaxID=517424 RepID=A0A2P8HYK6_9BACI|nr:spore germination protein [Salsuginibacillus halophilus]PSL51293.1 spore germination protein PA/spore germination protein PF [Salsuginibacillus halophilus]
MPGFFLGPIKLVENDGVVNFGDAFNISPSYAAKSVNGPGSDNLGGIIVTNNGLNITSAYDPDLIDQNVKKLY